VNVTGTLAFQHTTATFPVTPTYTTTGALNVFESLATIAKPFAGKIGTPAVPKLIVGFDNSTTADSAGKTISKNTASKMRFMSQGLQTFAKL
jgi:hypothetical protein